MIFNLFPLLPLDGGRILVGLLPSRAANVFARTEPYGMFILIALMLSGVLGWVLWPLVGGTMDAVYSVLGLR
jgi:Zn-dependent protease